MRRAVFLDRDGVINRALVRDGKPYPPASAAEIEVFEDAFSSLNRLREAGFLLFVVSNQPDIARGLTTQEVVAEIHSVLRSRLPVDEIYFCAHDDADACACRKPRPGMLLRAAETHGIDLRASFLIGDRWRDIDAGAAAGCRTVLIDWGYNERQPSHPPDIRTRSLMQAADWIISQKVNGQTTMTPLSKLRIKLFADGADKPGMLAMLRNPLISGFTTNPTLMRKAGITDYEAFARDILSEITTPPVSLEVFSDEFPEMERQARKISSWGPNVYVKIPVTNTRREPSYDLVQRLTADGLRLNVTAIMTENQVCATAQALKGSAGAFVSVFAGRIADTGRDPMPIMANAVSILAGVPQLQLIWASPRELLNLFQADAVGCHCITMTNDLLNKLPLVGKDLDEFSLDTVKMFREDAVKAGFEL
jgi:transaldolase